MKVTYYEFGSRARIGGCECHMGGLARKYMKTAVAETAGLIGLDRGEERRRSCVKRQNICSVMFFDRHLNGWGLQVVRFERSRRENISAFLPAR